MKFANALLRRLPSFLTYRDGTAIVPSFATSEWAERMFIKRLLRRLEVDCVIDVGANLGQYASELRMIGFTGLIVSFEPTPSLHRQIAARAQSDPKWHTIELALGSEPGVLTLNEMASPDFNSFHQPSVRDTDRVAGANKVLGTVDVQVETLSRLLPELQQQFGFKRPFLKMDTQGHDVAVFDGAVEVHDRLVGFQSEISVKRLYADTPRWTDAVARYEAAGFELAGLFAVNPGEDELCELDCFMVRRA